MDVIFSFSLRALNFHFGWGMFCGPSPVSIYPSARPVSINALKTINAQSGAALRRS